MHARCAAIVLVALVVMAMPSFAYVNEFDGYLFYRCSYGSGLTRLYSYHNNHNEDRRWGFECASAGSGGTGTTVSSGALNYHLFDQPISYYCPSGYFLDTLESSHDNNKEDRVWHFECRKASALFTWDCTTTSYLNSFDNPLDYTAPSGRFITGLFSYHDNNKEDRRWGVQTCQVQCDINSNHVLVDGTRRCTGISSSTIPNWAYVNDFHDPFYVQCSSNQGITRVGSYHDNRKEDRRWRFTCGSIGASDSAVSSTWSTAQWTSLQQGHSFFCPSNSYLGGLKSIFSPQKYDRIWSLKCVSLRYASLGSCTDSSYVNTFDNAMDYSAGATRVITGMSSYFSTSTRDRRYFFRTCEVQCDNGAAYYSDGGRGCNYAECGPLAISHGSTTGLCHGVPGEQCTQHCNTGYQIAEAQCTLISERNSATISCPNNGVIDRIDFASYGTPTGDCDSYSTSSCHASSSQSVVENTCLGKTSCTLSASNNVFSDPCSGIGKRLAVRYSCSNCVTANEGQTATLSCPSGSVISYIDFASYGLPSTASCRSFTTGTCHSLTSKSVVEQSCLNKQSCSIIANSANFGTPCSNSGKKLAVKFSCSQSTTRTCQEGGTWAGTTKVCEPVTCEPLSLSNGQLTGQCTGNYGDTCTYSSCSSGYWLSSSGSSSRTCQQDGTWSGSQKTCKPVSCPSLSISSGGFVSGSCTGNVGDVCTITCNPGYGVNPPNSATRRTCIQYGATASWTGPDISCRAITCGALTLTNGLVTGQCTGTLADTCTYSSCNTGYRLSSTRPVTRVCQQDGDIGVWTESAPTCQLITCPTITVAGGSLSGTCSSATNGATCTFKSCGSGYYPSEDGDTSVTCVPSGDSLAWSGSLKTCQEVTCSPLQLAHGSLSGSCDGKVGDTCRYSSCDSNFRLSSFGSTSRTCTQDGAVAVWSGTEKQCQEFLQTEAGSTFDVACSAGQGVVGLILGSSWGYVCGSVGADDQAKIWSDNPSVNSYRVGFDFTCPFGSYFLGGISSSFDSSQSDRTYGFQCFLLFGAELVDCRLESTYNSKSSFAYTAPEGYVITGIKSTFSSSRTYQPRVCKVQCKEEDGYYATASTRCQKIQCSPLSIENGAVSGACTGNIGDVCTVSSCNTGYYLSTSGTVRRECIIRDGAAVWSGSAKTCLPDPTTTTVAPTTTTDKCAAFGTTVNAATCKVRCNRKNDDFSFFKQYDGSCENVCSCGCRRRFRITKDESICETRCNALGLQHSFLTYHLGCGNVCLCQEDGVQPTLPGRTTATPTTRAIDGTAFDFPYADYNYQLVYTGALTGVSNPRRFSTAFDADATVDDLEVESILQCLRLCDAYDTCLGLYMRAVDNMLRCTLLSTIGTGVSTDTASISLTKSSSPAPTATSQLDPGTIETLAGNGQTTWNGQASNIRQTGLSRPECVSLDGEDHMLVTLTSDHRVIRVDLRDGSFETVAGTGTSGSDGVDGLAVNAQLNRPACAIADVQGNVFITEQGNHRVSLVDVRTKRLSVFAGTGRTGHRGMGGTARNALLNLPYAMAFDDADNLFVSDEGNNVVYRINMRTYIISVVAGTPRRQGYAGDGGVATSALLNGPTGIAVDGTSGLLFVADTANHCIRSVEFSTGLISTIAGTGTAGFDAATTAATETPLNEPHGVGLDASGKVLAIADSANHRVRQLDIVDAVLSTAAGTGAKGFNGDGADATTANLNYPTGVAIDAEGNIIIADRHNRRVRRVWI
eukprot:m.144440 g.144440  ORF g.144440 m.144440 type:complete len:1730 (-) comp16042_c0_seq1:350-5539(-)